MLGLRLSWEMKGKIITHESGRFSAGGQILIALVDLFCPRGYSKPSSY